MVSSTIEKENGQALQSRKSSTNRTRGSTWTRWHAVTTSASLGLILVIVLTAYYLNSPTPDGIQNPWKYRCLLASKRALVDLASTLSLITSTPYVDNFRFLMDMLVWPTPLDVPGSNIRASVTNFGKVKVRLYEPIRRKQNLGPAVVYVHGGAFAIGNAAIFDAITRPMAEQLDCTVVSVDYRLAPEYPFPAAFEDTLDASKWFMDHAQDFGVDRSRIGIAGDSAGGTLVAAVAQEMHDDRDYPDFAFQAPIYPLTQLIDSLTPGTCLSKYHFGTDGSIVTWQEAAMFCSFYLTGGKHDKFEHALLHNRHVSSEFRHSNAPQLQYVNHSLLPERLRNYNFLSTAEPIEDDSETDADDIWDEIKDQILDPRVCPLMRHDMSGLPATFVATCEYDAVRDHGIFYAMRLREAGVQVRWEHYYGGFHGVLGPSWPFVFEVGEKMFQDLITFIKEHLDIET